MKERSVHGDVVLPAHHQAAKISQPGKCPLHLPPPFIAPQLASILQWRFCTVLAMRTDQIDATACQALPQGVGITRLVINEPHRTLARTPPTAAGHRNRLQRRLDQRHFGWGRRFQEVSQRNPVAVDHHHPLRAFAPFGFPDAGPPFFAGAKLPSAKASDQSSWP
jgi:hypothetical protein